MKGGAVSGRQGSECYHQDQVNSRTLYNWRRQFTQVDYLEWIELEIKSLKEHDAWHAISVSQSLCLKIFFIRTATEWFITATTTTPKKKKKKKKLERNNFILIYNALPNFKLTTFKHFDMSPVHQVWAKPSCKAQRKGEEDTADRRSARKTSGNGQAWSSPSPRGQLRTEKNGGYWLWNHLWFRPSRLRDRWWYWRTFCAFWFFVSLFDLPYVFSVLNIVHNGATKYGDCEKRL